MTHEAHEVPATYLPGMSKHWLLPLYDPLTRLLGIEALRRRLAAAAGVGPGARVLDLGCGTGALAVRVAREHRDAAVVGLDPDPQALTRAAARARRAGVVVRWERGFAERVPAEDGAFDRVVSSMVLHHVDPDARVAALAEVRRVLAPGGELHLLDVGGAAGRVGGLVGRMAHHRLLADGASGRIPALLEQAGFADVEETFHVQRRVLGRFTAYRGVAPAG